MKGFRPFRALGVLGLEDFKVFRGSRCFHITGCLVFCGFRRVGLKVQDFWVFLMGFLGVKGVCDLGGVGFRVERASFV